MPIVTVPKPLRDKLGDDGADALVSLINEANGQVKTDVITLVEEKFERRLAEEIAKVNARITEQGAALEKRIAEQGAALEKRIAEQGAGLEARIAESRADLIRWMFVFWVGQIGVLLGILLAFFRQ